MQLCQGSNLAVPTGSGEERGPWEPSHQQLNALPRCDPITAAHSSLGLDWVLGSPSDHHASLRLRDHEHNPLLCLRFLL